MRISEHVSYAEATRTSVEGVANIPNPQQLENIKKLCKKVFEPLRNHVNNPIKINSIFRSEEVNRLIGGSVTSQHCNGEAMDIDDTYGFMSNNRMGVWIMENLDFDQLIFEKPINGKSSWLHVSYKDKMTNRRQVLIYTGKKYIKYRKDLLSL